MDESDSTVLSKKGCFSIVTLVRLMHLWNDIRAHKSCVATRLNGSHRCVLGSELAGGD